MFKNKIIYRLFLIFLAFALILIIPLSLSVRKEIKSMISQEEETVGQQSQAEKDIHTKFSERLTDNLLVFSFYTFIFAIIMSLFFSRNLLKPIRELYRGAKAIKEGNLGTRLEVIADDELGEVTKSFNEMAAALEKKTEELKRKELYVSAMMDPLWVVSDDNIIIDVNPAFTKLLGYEREEAIGSSVYDFLDETNTSIMKDQLSNREKGLSSIYEISIISKDGTPIPVLITGAPIIRDGVTVEKIGILKDFRREHQLRDEIQKSRDYLETIMDSIEDQMIVVNSDFRIIMANNSVKTQKGEGVIGDYCYSISHERITPCWTDGGECPAKKVFETGRIVKTIHQHRGAGGKRVFHEIVACPIKDSSGNVIHAIELMRDITDRKEYEENIAHKNKELTAINSIAGMLSRSLKAEEIFGNVLDKLLEVMNMDGGGIFLLDDSNKELTCSFHKGISDEFAKVAGRIRIGEDIPGKVAATGQLMTSSDIGIDQRVERSVFKHSGLKGFCSIPIKGKERVVGVFCLFSFKSRLFSTEEERLMTSIGEMTGIAIENIRLYEKMRQLYEYQRQRRADDYKNLFYLSSRLASALDIGTVMNATLDLIKSAFRADVVWLLEAENQNLILKADSGLNLSAGEIIYTRGTSSIESYAIEKRQPVTIAEISSEPRFYLSGHIGTNYKSACSIPVYVGEKVLGALTLYYSISKELKEDDTYFLQIVSSILAVALERSYLYEKTLLERELADTILQSISDGIMTVDTECRIISMNKAASDMIGIALEKISGTACCELFNFTDENTDFRWALGDCLDNALARRPSNIETVLTTTNGKKLSVLVSSSPVINSRGEVTGVVNALRNITREKEIDMMKTEFVKQVSHQFRTPLSAIIGMTEMVISEDIKGEKARGYLSTILSEGTRLSDMVAELLNIARIESGKEVFRDEDIDFKSLFENIQQLFLNILEKKKGKLSAFISGDVSGFKGDREKISQLLRNLVDNSIAFSDEKCEVRITVSRKDSDTIEMEVADNGWGIPEEDIPHLTERFYRGKLGQKTKGTGLGLALCSEIVARQGGSISFDSKLGQGTSVKVTLPFRRKQ